jgi:hypothetical protein
LDENIKKINRSKKTPKVYKVNLPYLTKVGTEIIGELDYMVPCPCCTGRAFDFSGIPQGLLRVRLKCPHCHRIVEASIVNEPDDTG